MCAMPPPPASRMPDLACATLTVLSLGLHHMQSPCRAGLRRALHVGPMPVAPPEHPVGVLHAVWVPNWLGHSWFLEQDQTFLICYVLVS